jgi:hypothetical protein
VRASIPFLESRVSDITRLLDAIWKSCLAVSYSGQSINVWDPGLHVYAARAGRVLCRDEIGGVFSPVIH